MAMTIERGRDIRCQRRRRRHVLRGAELPLRHPVRPTPHGVPNILGRCSRQQADALDRADAC